MRHFLTRCTLALSNAGSKMQTLQLRLFAGEVKDNVEHFESYGFTSNPHPGAEGLAAFLGGDRSHGVVICLADRRFRLQGLQSGEVALYTDEGDVLHFRRGRRIEVKTLTLHVQAGVEAVFDAPLTRFTGDVLVAKDLGVAGAADVVGDMTGGGSLTTAGDQIAAGVSQLKHQHPNIARGSALSDPPLPG